jgi:hypothetical protein
MRIVAAVLSLDPVRAILARSRLPTGPPLPAPASRPWILVGKDPSASAWGRALLNAGAGPVGVVQRFGADRTFSADGIEYRLVTAPSCLLSLYPQQSTAPTELTTQLCR